MESITVTPTGKENQTWTFQVEVGEPGNSTKHQVTVDEEYHLQLTNGHVPMVDLLNRTFIFLLSREQKESILRKFNLKEISRFFPEYEAEMRKMFIE